MVEDWKEVCYGDHGPYFFDANAEQNPDGDPPDTSLQRALKTTSPIVIGNPVELNEGVTLGSLEGLLAGFVPTSRLISTTLPLAGGGDLSADRTLVLNYNTNDLGLNGNNLYVKDAGINHDATTNFVANEHIDWTAATSAFSTTLTGHFGGALDTGGTFGCASGATLGSVVGDSHVIIGNLDINLDDAGGVVEIYALSEPPVLKFTFDWLGNITCAGDGIFDGGDIGITTHPNLIQMAANALAFNGTITTNQGTATSAFKRSATQYLSFVCDGSGNKLQSLSDAGAKYFYLSADSDKGVVIATGSDGSEPFYVMRGAPGADPTTGQALGFVLDGTSNRIVSYGAKDFEIRVPAGQYPLELFVNNVQKAYVDASGNVQFDGNAIFDGGNIGPTTDPDLLGLALNTFTVRGEIHSSGNLWIRAAASSYVAIEAGASAAQYYDAGGIFTWRDVDAANATRMTLDSANGLLSPTTVQPTSGYNSVDGNAGITQTINIVEGASQHQLVFKNGILTVYTFA